MAFVEHNNRAKAKKLAEYITGDNLRRYVAQKVKQYAGDNISVFDGAAGSGQLEQYINTTHFVAVEIQAESCQALQNNYPYADVHHGSFFVFEQKADCDCVIMNPPFSIKLKDLSENEQAAIKANFVWKKSGVVDDIFVLKGLEQSKRWGFFILSCGLAYRKTELQLRTLIGNRIVELNRIQNAFDDTNIDVMFLVIDKAKTDNTTVRELFDCGNNKLIIKDEWTIEAEHWELLNPPAAEKEAIDPAKLEFTSRELLKKRVISELQFSKMIVDLAGAVGEISGINTYTEFNSFCDELCDAIQNEKVPI